MCGTLLGLWLYILGPAFQILTLVVAFFVVVACLEGRQMMSSKPKVGRWLIEVWVLAPVIFGAAATMLILLATLQLPIEHLVLSRSFPKDDLNEIEGVIKGAIVGYVSFVLLKDVSEGGGIFSVASQFKSAIGSVVFNYEVPEEVADAMCRDSIRGRGEVGWGFADRGPRAQILADHLKDPKSQAGIHSNPPC